MPWMGGVCNLTILQSSMPYLGAGTSIPPASRGWNLVLKRQHSWKGDLGWVRELLLPPLMLYELIIRQLNREGVLGPSPCSWDCFCILHSRVIRKIHKWEGRWEASQAPSCLLSCSLLLSQPMNFAFCSIQSVFKRWAGLCLCLSPFMY